MENFRKDAIKIFKALSDPIRYEMIKMLVSGEKSCGDFNKSFKLSKSGMSHHYRILENAGLVNMRKEGLHAYFTLDKERLEKFIPDFSKVHLHNFFN